MDKCLLNEMKHKCREADVFFSCLGSRVDRELHSSKTRTSIYQYAEVAGEGAEAHFISLTLLLKVSMPLLKKGVFTSLAATRHKKMLTILLTQLETGVTPIWVN